MSAVKNILKTNILKTQVEEYLMERLRNASFGGVDITFTAIGTRVTIYSMRPGRVIGSKGRVIKEVTRTLEQRFKLENPQVTVAEIEVPELNPYVMAQRIASAVERGVRFKRVCFWALDRMIAAGAHGVEIEISGKTRSARSRSMKFKAGFMPKCGDVAVKSVEVGKAAVQLKTGIFGVKISMYPPDAPIPDALSVLPPAEADEAEETIEVIADDQT